MTRIRKVLRKSCAWRKATFTILQSFSYTQRRSRRAKSFNVLRSVRQVRTKRQVIITKLDSIIWHSSTKFLHLWFPSCRCIRNKQGSKRAPCVRLPQGDARSNSFHTKFRKRDRQRRISPKINHVRLRHTSAQGCKHT